MKIKNRWCLARNHFRLEDESRDSDTWFAFIGQLLDGITLSVQGSTCLDCDLRVRLHGVIKDIINVSSQLILDSRQDCGRRDYRRRKPQPSHSLAVQALDGLPTQRFKNLP